MPTVAVNPPKTPVTQGSGGIATATLPNICKMPPPPAPFAPTPLPNIGMSGKEPMGYSTTVKIEGAPVAITGSMFGSVGDIASKGTGGGVVSNNAEGPTTFLAPGSLDVRIEGKNVQLLGDQMLNNCGPLGAPPNSATMGGVLQAPLPGSGPGDDSPPPEDPKCKKIREEIDRLINSVRPPTPPGGFPQGYQGLAKRWEEFATSGSKFGPGKARDNHLKQYKDAQKKLQEQLEKWNKNGCDNKPGPPLPPLAKEYAEQEPEVDGPTQPVPKTDAPTVPVTVQDLAKTLGVTTTVVVVLVVISRIVRCLPPLLPLQASPI